MVRKEVLWPAAGLLCMGLGGFLIHLKIHPPSANAFNWVAFVAGLASFTLIPLLLCARRTAPWGYLLNAVTVVLGTVTMAFYSATHLPDALSLKWFFVDTTFPDILILLAKLPLAGACLRAHRRHTAEQGDKP
jgi:hypothetical protein